MDEIIEEWKPVVGYEGIYEVSSLGRVKSLNYNHTKQEKILKQNKNKDGYLYVNIHKQGKGKNFTVHRLVANAFIPNPNIYPCVNHKDEDKTNNCVSNLEWCDVKYNTNFGTSIQRRVEKQSKQVYQYDEQGNLVKLWPSTQECKRNGFNRTNIYACCIGKLRRYKGFKWSYTEIKKEQGN